MATLQTLPEAAALLPTTPRPGGANFATRSVLYATFKHIRLVIGLFFLVAFLVAVAFVAKGPSWRANTKVLVKLGEVVQVAPAQSPSRTVHLPLSTEVVNTEAEIVRSREVVATAVQRLGLVPEDGDLDALIAGMQLALTVAPTPASNVLRISFVGKDRERVAQNVNAITEAYIEHHNRLYQNEGIHTFYTEQLSLLEKEMKKAQEQLQAYLKQENIVDVDQEITLLTQEVIEQEKGLRSHLAKLAGTKRKLEQVTLQLAATPERVKFSEEWLSNPTLLTFKDRLAALEIERYQAQQLYMPTDRHVTDLDAKIGSIKSRIKDEQDRILNKQTMQRNDLHRELQRNAYTLEVLLEDLDVRVAPLQARLDKNRARLAELADKRFIVHNLKQIADERAYEFDLYQKKEEEARISEAMTSQSLVNVNVVERATPPLDPEDGFLLPLLVALLVGPIAAVMMAVGVEYLNRTLRFEEEVERCLELPVLAVIPDLHTVPEVAG